MAEALNEIGIWGMKIAEALNEIDILEWKSRKPLTKLAFWGRARDPQKLENPGREKIKGFAY